MSFTKRNVDNPGPFVLSLCAYMMVRVRNLLAKFCEILVYKVIAPHSRKPKIRNMNPKFSKLAKGGPELNPGLYFLRSLLVTNCHIKWIKLTMYVWLFEWVA